MLKKIHPMTRTEDRYEVLKDVRENCTIDNNSKECEDSLNKAKKVFSSYELETISESLNIVIK